MRSMNAGHVAEVSRRLMVARADSLFDDQGIMTDEKCASGWQVYLRHLLGPSLVDDRFWGDHISDKKQPQQPRQDMAYRNLSPNGSL